ncbi:uncharacterized [Tachysurus ichikawai]
MLRLSSVKQNFASNMKNAEEALFMIATDDVLSEVMNDLLPSCSEPEVHRYDKKSSSLNRSLSLEVSIPQDGPERYFKAICNTAHSGMDSSVGPERAEQPRQHHQILSQESTGLA